jgi:hypothetical protein
MVTRKKLYILFLAVVMAFGSLISVSAATQSPTTGPTNPTTPTNVSVNVQKKKVRKKGKNSLKVTWKKEKGTKVHIQLLKKKNGKWKVTGKTYVVNGNKGKTTIKNIKKGKYKWRIYATRTVSGKTYKSSVYTSKKTRTFK